MNDTHWMREALQLAHQAEMLGEVPVGSLVVLGDEIIGKGFNRTITDHDPTAHAEIVALRAAGQHISNYRLPGSTLFVTLEPCAMCVGAMIHARVDRLVFGAHDPKTGAAGGSFDFISLPDHNHHISVTGGVLSEECGLILRDFFVRKRKKHKN